MINNMYFNEVDSVIEFFENHNLWYSITKNNGNALGCGDAASKRERLGHIGIPIFDELKSELGYIIDSNTKEKIYVLTHCRGNQKIDDRKRESFLLSRHQRLTSEDDINLLIEHSTLKSYIENNEVNIMGVVNPFIFSNDIKIIQIFDKSVLVELYPPFTMMTNASHREYGIEFKPKELIYALNNAKVLDVIEEDNYSSFKRHKIGIITGNGPDSGMMLWNNINDRVKKSLLNKRSYSFTGDLSYPEIVVESLPEMGLSMELNNRFKETKIILLKTVTNLCKSGVSILCLACNTTQYFIDEIEIICRRYDTIFISMPHVVDEVLKQKNITHFDLLGDRKSSRLNSSHTDISRMPSSA